MKIKLDGVAETLLITLNARAKDYKNPKSVLHDKKSFEIASQLDYDFKKFDTAWASYYGILARAYIMDEEVKKFIEKYPDCVIVSIGCGLDTRFERVDNGKITWYNLDLPEVIETRKSFFKENDRVKNISKSVFENEWTKEVITDNKELLIISEGVIMYFDESEVKKILETLVNNFKKFELHLDLLYKGTVKMSSKHDTLKKMDNVVFKWGVKDGSEIVKLEPKLKQIGLINFTKKMAKILPFSKKIFIPLMWIVNNRLGIYTYNK
ncbi:methyltransferase [Fusobacterium hwasookii ChDC F174]|uniref:Methyltransferase n=1 Tax=Fusobacterium hwasookii ChDC F174 TaxID=1307442 RepID=A0A0S2ZPH1_9FUSO|nr:class I SAM-dependent methyltransferase [Fusobacterium hwasookii]ALQ40843.1 methyltransferase [Fusobacterium hwasookii ChDC F174]